MKLIAWVWVSISAQRLTRSLPLISSAPMFKIATRGACCRCCSASAAPITANWNRESASLETFAPRSSIQVLRPEIVGRAETSAGRSIPGSNLRRKRDSAIKAPVFPPLTHASAWFSATRSIAMPIELPALWRKASEGFSELEMTRSLCTILKRVSAE